LFSVVIRNYLLFPLYVAQTPARGNQDRLCRRLPFAIKSLSALKVQIGKKEPIRVSLYPRDHRAWLVGLQSKGRSDSSHWLQAVGSAHPNLTKLANSALVKNHDLPPIQHILFFSLTLGASAPLAQQKTVAIRAVENTATIELKKLPLKCEAQNRTSNLMVWSLKETFLRQATGTPVARKTDSCRNI
jgi:hypothetical protein